MEVWNPMLWEFSRVMRECHRKIGAMLGKNKPPVGQAPIMGLLRTQDGLTQEEVSERLQRNETSVALAVKRLVQEARDRGMLIDATFGRKTASVFIMDSDHVVLSALSTEKMAPRLGLTVKDLTEEE